MGTGTPSLLSRRNTILPLAALKASDMRDRCLFSRFAEDSSGNPAVGWSGADTGLAEGPLGAGESVTTWGSGGETFCFGALVKKRYAPIPTTNTPPKTYKAAGTARFRPGT